MVKKLPFNKNADKQHWVKFYEGYLKGNYKLSLVTYLATNFILPFTEDDDKNGGLYEKCS